ncbi:MAG: hypothetical protein WA064_02410 [Candidatus Moraniibacteriota bacterium]|jgi:hypothetical protein
MHTKTVKRGGSEETLYDLFIVNVNDGENEHSAGAVSHLVGSDEVMIRSTHRSYGAVPVGGRENLKCLRDALIEICRMENIH